LDEIYPSDQILVHFDPGTSYEAGSFMLPNIRFGAAADYELSPNIVVTVSPLSLSFSPKADGMYGSSLREINFVIGIGYHQ